MRRETNEDGALAVDADDDDCPCSSRLSVAAEESESIGNSKLRNIEKEISNSKSSLRNRSLSLLSRWRIRTQATNLHRAIRSEPSGSEETFAQTDPILSNFTDTSPIPRLVAFPSILSAEWYSKSESPSDSGTSPRVLAIPWNLRRKKRDQHRVRLVREMEPEADLRDTLTTQARANLIPLF